MLCEQSPEMNYQGEAELAIISRDEAGEGPEAHAEEEGEVGGDDLGRFESAAEEAEGNEPGDEVESDINLDDEYYEGEMALLTPLRLQI